MIFIVLLGHNSLNLPWWVCYCLKMFRLELLWPTAAELSDRRYLGFLALHDSFFSHFSNSGLLYYDFHVLLIWSRVTKHFYSRISWDNGTSSTLQVILGERILLGIAFLSNCEKWSLSPIGTSTFGLELHTLEILLLIFIHTNHWKRVQEEFSVCTVAFTPHLLFPEKLPKPLTCVFCMIRQEYYASFLLCTVHIQKKMLFNCWFAFLLCYQLVKCHTKLLRENSDTVFSLFV